MKQALVILLAIGTFALTACGGPDKADSGQDIVGSWQRVGGGAESYCRYESDGSYHCAGTLEEIDRNEGFEGSYRFEGDQYIDLITEDSDCPEVGIYEIHIQANGNLKFIVVEDDCRDRLSDAVGRGIEEGLIAWQKVP